MRLLSIFSVILFLTSVPAAAQQHFGVAETSPAVRDSSVALEATVTFTFSQPVDTTARFDGEGPLAFYATGGEDLSIDSAYVSNDLTSFSFDVRHHVSGDYVWILTGAFSEDGSMLCAPYALWYTTRDGWGGGVVEGLAGEVVAVKAGVCSTYFKGVPALLDARPDSSARLVAATNVEETDFRFEGVRDGVYWPILLHDWRGDGIIRPDWDRAGDSESGIGVYDPEWDQQPDSIVVADTSDIYIEILAFGSGSVEGSELPGTARLLQNYPNPFERSTTIAFELERPLDLTMTVYDLLGRQIATPASGFYQTGRHEVDWNPASIASGLYVVRLAAEGFVLTRRMIRLGATSSD